MQSQRCFTRLSLSIARSTSHGGELVMTACRLQELLLKVVVSLLLEPNIRAELRQALK